MASWETVESVERSRVWRWCAVTPIVLACACSFTFNYDSHGGSAGKGSGHTGGRGGAGGAQHPGSGGNLVSCGGEAHGGRPEGTGGGSGEAGGAGDASGAAGDGEDPGAGGDAGAGGADAAGAAGLAGNAGDPGCSQRAEIEVSALIDGHDRLFVTPGSIRYEHYSFAGPGMAAEGTLPTALKVSVGSTVSEIPWCPSWENGCNTCEGTCGALVTPMNSETFLWDFPRGCLSFRDFECSGAEGREPAACTLDLAPEPASGYLAIIDMNDDVASGQSYYTARVSFDFVEDGTCGCSVP